MDRKTMDDGVVYISCDVLCVGDYGGAGAVGEANIRALEDMEDAYVEGGCFSSRRLWLPDTPECQAIIEKLERAYPLVDEEEHSRVESEWEQEAWKSYGRYDLARWGQEYITDAADELLSDDEMFGVYRKAMEEENQYPTMEYSSASLPLDDIAVTYANTLTSRLDAMLTDALQGAPPFDLSDTLDRAAAADWLLDTDRWPLGDYLRGRTEAQAQTQEQGAPE